MPVNRCDPYSYKLANNLSASGAAVAIPGGEYDFFAEGVAGGSTVSLQFQAPFTTTWIDVQVFNGSPVKSATLPFSQTDIELPAGNVRMAATGGAPSGLNASLIGLG
jgi:hypothetical protein